MDPSLHPSVHRVREPTQEQEAAAPSAAADELNRNPAEISGLASQHGRRAQIH
jgi:hypothetical protein